MHIINIILLLLLLYYPSIHTIVKICDEKICRLWSKRNERINWHHRKEMIILIILRYDYNTLIYASNEFRNGTVDTPEITNNSFLINYKLNFPSQFLKF